MSQSEETKLKIFNSAVKVFADKGFWCTKVSDIVADAGVAQGTFYNYFKSKDDCFKYILLKLHYESLDTMDSIANYQGNDGLFTLFDYIVERFISLKSIVKIFLFEARSYSEEFRDILYTFKDNVRGIINRFLENIHYADCKSDADVKSFMLVALVREISETLILRDNKSEMEIKTFVHRAISLIIGVNR